MKIYIYKIILCFIFAIVLCAAYPVCASIGGGATIIGITGEVEYSVDGGASWSPAALKLTLTPGASVRTGAGAGTALLLPGGTTMKLNENSSFTLSDGDSASAGTLDEGDLWALMETGGDEITVNTPSAVVAVRGTEFALSVDRDETSTLTVVEGNTTFANQYGSVRVLSSQQSTASPGSAPTPPKVVDPKNWIEWTLDIRAMGSAVEFSFNKGTRRALETLRDKLEGDVDDEDYKARLELARVYHDLGDYENAEYEFNACLDDDDSLWDAIFGLGMSRLGKGDVEGALAEFGDLQWSVGEYLKKMKKIAEEKRRAYIEEQERIQSELVMSGKTITGEKGLSRRRPTVYIEETDKKKLPPIVVDTLETEAARAMAHEGMGFALLRKNESKRAADEFAKALKIEPGMAQAHVGAAEASIRLGKVKDALGSLDRALKIDADNYQALVRLAAVQLASNKLDRALEYSRQAVEAAPDSAVAEGVLARVRFYRMEYEEARKVAETAIALDHFSPAGHEVLARILIMKKKYRQAANEALTSLALDEDNAFANDDLAMIYYLHRKYDGAIRRWRRAIEADANYSTAKIHLARLYNELEETAKAVEAEKLARAVLKKEKQNTDAISELARSLELQRKYAEAEKSFLDALAVSPRHAKTLARLASFYVDRHRMDLALEFAIKATTAQPENPENHFILGRAYEAVDNLDGAESAYLTALSLDPEYELARYQLGIIYAGQGKTYDALDEMHSAALLEPRVVTLAEYRGPSRVYATSGSNHKRYIEGVHTGDAKDYKYNYRFVLTAGDTDGHRDVNGWSKNRGGSLLVGLQQDRDSTFLLYYDYSIEEQGEPGPDEGSRANDTNDFSNFHASRADLSYRKRISPGFSMSFRAGNGRSNSFDFDSNDAVFTQDTYEDEFKNKNNEYEIRADLKYSDRTEFVFGGFQSDSQPESNSVYRYFDLWEDGFVSNLPTCATATYKQRNGYVQMKYRSGHKVEYMAGAENVFHDYLGSEAMQKYGIDYRIDDRSRLRYINKETYKLSYTPRYQPRDGWMYLDATSSAAAGTETRQKEIYYETRLPRGDFLKVSAFDIKNWWHSHSGGIEKVLSIDTTRGYRAEYERLLSRKANIFAAVANKQTREATPGSTYYGNLLPYARRTGYTAGLYYFPSSFVTVKIIYDRYGNGFSDAANERELDRIGLTRLQVRYDPRIDLSYMLTVRNLFDKEYEFTENYPEDGRTWDLSVIRWF